MKHSSLARRLPLILATVLLVCTRLSAQEAPRVIIGNTDGSPVNVTAQCDVTLPLWIDLPGWVNYGLISLLGNHLIITQWINAEILYPWEYITRIDGDLISLSFRPVPSYPDSLFHLVNFTFHIDADSSYWGQPISAIFSGPLMFVDSLGWLIDDITPLISPLCIECLTATDDPASLPDEITYSAYPNPFNASVAVSMSLPRPGDLSLTIYDIAGRRVKTLYGGAASGNLQVIWDGTGKGGKPVSSGTYYYRMEFENQIFASKVTLLK